jgi:hypothetical protein
LGAVFTGRVAARAYSFDVMGLSAMAQALDVQLARTELQQQCAPIHQLHVISRGCTRRIRADAVGAERP